ncbi:MAG: hypothetical protein M1834_002231 [Cirrosporium novae-zelandiae]|nr:MAG: hypothetical protein M1834_002231 [Cirrosporium novae-zelandiae]
MSSTKTSRISSPQLSKILSSQSSKTSSSQSSTIISRKRRSDLLDLPQELIDHIIAFLPLTTLLTLKQANQYFHGLLVEKTSSVGRQQVWEYLRFAENWPTPIGQETKGKALTCYGCLRLLPRPEFDSSEWEKKKGGDKAYGRCCRQCYDGIWKSFIAHGSNRFDPDNYPALFCCRCREFKWGFEAETEGWYRENQTECRACDQGWINYW